MDAPTTTSADNGTSGGGGGWFTPRKKPTTTPDNDAGTPDNESGTTDHESGTTDHDPGTIHGRRPAVIRPVGRQAADPETPADGTAAPPTSTADSASTGAPDEEHGPPDANLGPAPTAPPSAPSPEAPSPRPAPATGTPPPASFASATAPPAEQRVPTQRPAPVSPSEPAASAPGNQASPDAILIRRAMAEVTPVADKVTSYFYALLFVRHPDLRPLFPAAMDTQRDRLLRALLTAAEHIDNTDVLVDYLQNLGRGHRKYGTRPEHYPAVGECLIAALSKYAAGVWNAEMEAAWVRTYTTISQIMIDAAAADELRAPAWWYAEIVTHDLRTPDVAVVTVRPDQPYPFLAGQYTSLETPWWPRIWRHYSFASAPRSDGLLSFHVKAVPAGWVSNALVHRARPGDIVRLGPPAGSMTVDHTTDSGLLCLGGGTGIAPIKALVEDVAEHGERRPVEVFYGARTDHDLYDIDTMLRLQQSHPWLSVRAIIDQLAHQQLPDAVRAYGPWNEFDAYLSGPPGMIRNGVDTLRDIGIPSERIRHDSVEELVAAGP
nr:globin domain-containing protein [Streptomyces africanus]